MATLLRSLKYVRKLPVCGTRRLGLNFNYASGQTSSPTNLRIQCLTEIPDHRNYVTNVAVDQNFQDRTDAIIDRIDAKVQQYNNTLVHDVEGALKEVNNTGSMTSIQALLLLRCCGDLLFANLDRRRALAESVWETINKLGVQLDVSHYNALLLVNLENKKDFSCSKILLEMKTRNIVPNGVTFQRLIQQFCDHGDIDGATKILEHMKEQNLPINETIFCSLIKGHSVAGDPTSALDVFKIMAQTEIKPSSQSYTAILCVYAKIGDLEALNRTLNEYESKNIVFSSKQLLEVTYTLVINGHVEQFEQLLTSVIERSMDGITTSDAIRFMSKLMNNSQANLAYSFIKILLSKQPPLVYRPFLIKNFLVYLVLNAKDSDTVIHYCKLLQKITLQEDPFLTSLYNAFRAKATHLMLPLLRVLKEHGEEIREHYFYPVLMSCRKTNNNKAVLNIMKEMNNHFSIIPSNYTVSTYILPQIDTHANPMRLVETLIENGLTPTTAVSATIMYLCSNDKIQEAQKLMQISNRVILKDTLYEILAKILKKKEHLPSVIEMIHCQYRNLLNIKGVDNVETTAKRFAGNFLMRNFDDDVVTTLIDGLLEKGISIDSESAEEIKRNLGEKLMPETSDALTKLASGKLSLNPINSKHSFQKLLELNPEEFKRAQENYDPSEFKMLLIAEYTMLPSRHNEIHPMLEELEKLKPNYTASFCESLVKYFSYTHSIKEADKWFGCLQKLHPEHKMRKSVVLYYAKELVSCDRSSDALRILRFPVLDPHENRSILCTHLIMAVEEKCPEYIENFLKILVTLSTLNAFKDTLRSVIFQNIQANKIDKAISLFRWASANYKIALCNKVLTSTLIKNDDLHSLQTVTDICVTLFGENNALIDLAVEFWLCDRAQQARKILESPKLSFTNSKLEQLALYLIKKDETGKQLQEFIYFLKGTSWKLLFSRFFMIVLDIYEKERMFDQCQSLWTRMQEDDMQPSLRILDKLEEILLQKDQLKHSKIVVQNITHKFDEALYSKNYEEARKIADNAPKQLKGLMYMHLLKNSSLFIDNTNQSLKYLRKLFDINQTMTPQFAESIVDLISHLVNKDDIANISYITKEIYSRWEKSKDLPLLNQIINQNYLESGKYLNFVNHLDSLDNEFISLNVRFALKAMQTQPEIEEKIKEYAFKSCHKDTKPITIVWINEFLKGSPEADKIWDMHLKNSSGFLVTASVYQCINIKSWDKIPKMIEKILESSTRDKHKRISCAIALQGLLQSDAPNKYELAYECLRHTLKTFAVEQFNQKDIQTLEQNLPDGLTIESLKKENKAKGQATD